MEKHKSLGRNWVNCSMHLVKLAGHDSLILFWKTEAQFCPAWMIQKIWDLAAKIFWCGGKHLGHIKKICFVLFSPSLCAMYITFIFASQRLQEKRYMLFNERETNICKAGLWSPEKTWITKPGSMIPDSISSVYNLPCGLLCQKLRLVAKKQQLLKNTTLPVQPGGLTALSSSNAAIYCFPCVQWVPFSALLK